MSLRPRLTRTLLAATAATPLFVAGCKPSAPAEPAPKPEPVAAAPAVAPAPAPAPAQPVTASVSGTTVPDCVGPFSNTGEEKSFKIGARTFKLQGSTLTVTGEDADDQVVFGVIANVKEATGENLFNLRRYLEFFKAEKVEAILVAGDSAEKADGIAQVLEPIAKAGLPTFVIPGNRESRSDFHAAIKGLAAKYPGLFDMSVVRLVNFDDASVVSLPGYYDKRFIHAGEDGCQYFKEDVAALEPIVAAATQPVVLLSHAEPLGKGNDAIDAFSDGNAGDANLTAFLRGHKAPFVIAANIQEAGGRATDLDSTPIAENTPKAQLLLNPGLADSTPWQLKTGGWSYGMVSTLTVKGGQASYKLLKSAQLTEKETAEARKLEPVAK